MEIISVSTVTPVYSGKQYLKDLILEIAKVRDSWEASGSPLKLNEAIFVDDSSSDGSLAVLEDLAEKYPWVRVIPLSKNFGQHSATVAGILHTSGDWVLTLDEDLQHHPKFFEELFVKASKDGLDVVYAKPEEGVHNSVFRDYSSKLYKWLLAKLTGNSNIRLFNSFRLIRGPIARAMASVSCFDGYLDIILSWYTNKVGSVKLPLEDIRFQQTNQSGYSLMKLISHARKLLVSSHAKVIRTSSLFGAIAVFLASSYGLFVFFQKLLFPENISIAGWTSLMILGLFFGGIISFFLGIVLEYTGVILLQLQGKPAFFVVDRKNDYLLKPLAQGWSPNRHSVVQREAHREGIVAAESSVNAV